VNRRTLLIGVGAALGVLLIWYFLLWSPRGSAITKAKARRTAAEGQVQELQAELNRLQEAKRNEAAIRAQVEDLRQAIPDEPNLAQFILDTNDAATRSGIDFLSITPTPPAAAPPSAASGVTPAGAPSQITLGVAITGGYFQVLDFVNRLTDLTRIVVIDGLSVAPGANATLSVQISGRMFTNQAPPSAPGSVTTTTTTPGATTTTVPGGATPTTVAG
jgi:type IV pilus assembly protein PilO